MSFMWQAWDIEAEAHLIHPDKYKGVDTLRVYARVGPKTSNMSNTKRSVYMVPSSGRLPPPPHGMVQVGV